jgi:phosphoribosyl 1,2-cyclic phosphate phosphodiesterase
MSGFTLTFLGSGTSYGIPMIGCHCPTCTSQDPRDNRLRSSVWIHNEDVSLLIDSGPDLRLQALRYGIERLDAMLLTHTHADHLNGLDDLRAFTRLTHQPLPVYAAQEHIQFLMSHFEYVFQERNPAFGWGIPRLEPHAVWDAPFTVGPLCIQPVPLLHGRWLSIGYRMGNLAYLTDCSGIPESSLPLLEGIQVLVIDALRTKPHPTHLHFDSALALARFLGAAHTYFTHISHETLHASEQARLPEDITIAYDGLNLNVSL